MRSWRSCLFTLILLSILGGLAFAEEPKTAPEQAVVPSPKKIKATTAPKPKSELDILAQQLTNPDVTTQQTALDRIKQILSEPRQVDDTGRLKPARVQVSRNWLVSLMKVIHLGYCLGRDVGN